MYKSSPPSFSIYTVIFLKKGYHPFSFILATMSTLSMLSRAEEKRQVPPDSYIFYSMSNEIFCISVKNYSRFAIQWSGEIQPPPLTMDLCWARDHSIVLDFDSTCAYSNELLKTMWEVMESVFRTTFLSIVPHFTYIIAMRQSHMGMHVHFPEFRIAYDDYVLLCEFLLAKFRSVVGDRYYKVDVLANATLPGAAEPDQTPYVPVRVVYVDEKTTLGFNVVEFSARLNELTKGFKPRKTNEKSLFKKILQFHPTIFKIEMKQMMMPVVAAHTPLYTVQYGTTIGSIPQDPSDWDRVATFRYKNPPEQGGIYKLKHLERLPYGTPLKVYNFFKFSIGTIEDLQTNHRAIEAWYDQFSRVNSMDNSHIPLMFRDIHSMLQLHMALEKNPNPIKQIMQDNDGYYFLPVFYALCKHYHKDSSFMADQLVPLLDVEFHPLLDKLRAVHPKVMEYLMADISIHTIHFCANNLCEKKPDNYRDRLKFIVNNNQRSISSVSNLNQMITLVRSIQEQNLPIRVFKLKNSLKKPTRFVWNALSEVWQEMIHVSEISDHLQNLWSHIKQSIHEWPEGPDEELVQKMNISTIVSTILSDSSMERKDIQMDTHKWFLRLPDGVLDLLTGHVGGVVPEFYISERKMDLGIPRPQMQILCRGGPSPLVALAHLLTEKTFFLKYLRGLFLNQTDQLYQTLYDLVLERGDVDDLLTGTSFEKDIAISMLHFYVNLCKCACFEYDWILYMMDILASVFIATNYERKFFVWKGVTRNGKSKFLELMGRVLGGYYHSIESENFSPRNSSNGNATPELASTLFACRMVCSEELEKKVDENRVKKLTGNNIVAFRNMYEQNSGGIPMAKMFVTTNNYPECRGTEAFKDRVVAINFDAEFVDKAPDTTKEQLMNNTFRKDVYVVEQSFKGCFFMLYTHLKKHMSLSDGLLHYRDEPECVSEYTQEYLIHTDIYVQFKIHMDVQEISGRTTTMNEVKSAVRQYLKGTNNTSYPETELVMHFQNEFSGLQRTDLDLGSMESFSYTTVPMNDDDGDSEGLQEESVPFTSVLEEEAANDEPARKKTKKDNSNILIYFDGVVIKNRKRALDF